MPFVQRDSTGVIVAVSRDARPGFDETVDDGDGGLQQFLASVGPSSNLARTDIEFVRVLEDLLDVLIAKNVLLFTELPGAAQAKVLERQALRRDDDALNLLDDEPRV